MANHQNYQEPWPRWLKQNQGGGRSWCPFPAQGHLNQLLHLSRLIMSYNIPIHYACSAMHHIRQAMNKEKLSFSKGLKRVKDKGLVVRDLGTSIRKFLATHQPVLFMSHCGWNSCMESITMGVPIAAWPMASDQPRNTVLITSLLKVGIVVKDWSRRDQLVTSSTIRKCL
uniref:Glycosyltransferase N-terminal domain-containing protein n=1 Tax=Fagus sylvatica TaxID=28930 RepID=A0A2N9FG78_FAGSY